MSRSKPKAPAMPTRKKHMQFQLPAQRIYEVLAEGFPTGVSTSSTVFMTAVLEYVTAEVLELACKKATERKSRHITRGDIAFVMQTDEELKNAFPGAGVPPPEEIDEVHRESSLFQERLSQRLESQ